MNPLRQTFRQTPDKLILNKFVLDFILADFTSKIAPKVAQKIAENEFKWRIPVSICGENRYQNFLQNFLYTKSLNTPICIFMGHWFCRTSWKCEWNILYLMYSLQISWYFRSISRWKKRSSCRYQPQHSWYSQWIWLVNRISKKLLTKRHNRHIWRCINSV